LVDVNDAGLAVGTADCVVERDQIVACRRGVGEIDAQRRIAPFLEPEPLAVGSAQARRGGSSDREDAGDRDVVLRPCRRTWTCVSVASQNAAVVVACQGDVPGWQSVPELRLDGPDVLGRGRRLVVCGPDLFT
jgi:hypothetical protein